MYVGTSEEQTRRRYIPKQRIIYDKRSVRTAATLFDASVVRRWIPTMGEPCLANPTHPFTHFLTVRYFSVDIRPQDIFKVWGFYLRLVSILEPHAQPCVDMAN